MTWSGPARRRTLPIALAVATLATGAVAAVAAAATGAAGDMAAVALVIGVGLALFAAALVVTAGILSRGVAAGYRAAGEPVPERPAPARPRIRFALVGPALLVGVLGSLGARWYGYVTNTETPFDEVGIDLNVRAPAVLRAWGCGRLRATFGRATLPPYGCAAPGDATRWR